MADLLFFVAGHLGTDGTRGNVPKCPMELITRIKALLRRTSTEESNVMKFDNLVVDHIRHEVLVDGQVKELTFKEYELLRYLALNAGMVLISILAILITSLSITIVYYELFQEQVKKDLAIEANLIRECGIENLSKSEDIRGSEQIRVTWIAAEGTVLYDNDADASSLENHRNRPEIIAVVLKLRVKWVWEPA